MNLRKLRMGRPAVVTLLIILNHQLPISWDATGPLLGQFHGIYTKQFKGLFEILTQRILLLSQLDTHQDFFKMPEPVDIPVAVRSPVALFYWIV